MRRLNNKAFTLIEILVVIAILAILAVVVFVALNPAQRFADTRNARRFNDVNSILTAINECIVDNGGDLATCGGLDSLTADETYEIVFDPDGAGALLAPTTACDAVCGAEAASNCTQLDADLAEYLKSIPTDPGGVAAGGHTEYSVSIDSNNLITIASCSAENGEVVEVSR